MGEPSTEPFGTARRICTRRPERSRNLRNLDETLANLLQNLLATQDGSGPESQRHHETWRTLVEPWCTLAGTLVEPRWNGTFHRTFWQPKTDLPHKTRDTTKLAQPSWSIRETLVEPRRHLGGTSRGTFWRPKTDHREPGSNSVPKPLLWLKTPSYCCWGKTLDHSSLGIKPNECSHLNDQLILPTSSTAQGGGGSFKKRKTIGEVGCCESRMSKQKHWPTD